MQTRNKSFLLRLTEQEYATLKRKSELAGLKMNPFLVSLINGCEIHPRTPDSCKALARQVAAVGNNLNQLARIANFNGKAEDAYKAKLTHELEVLTQKRKYLYNHKEVLTPDVRNRRLEELSARMRTVRRELNTCTDIETDAAALQLKWQEVRQAEKEEREVNENEQRRRSR